MSKKIIEAEFQKIDRAGLAEDKFKNFLHKWWQPILYSIGGLLVFSVLLYQFTRGSGTSTIQDYMRADQVYTEFATAQGAELEEKLANLQAFLRKYPDLKQKYDGKIAQTLLSKNKPALAIPFAQSSMTNAKRIGTAPYQTYSDTSLLIAQGKLEEALVKAKSLQSTLAQDDTLFAFNMMRIATLENELGNKKEAKATYQKLLALGNSNPLFDNWLNSYKEGELTYREYIKGL